MNVIAVTADDDINYQRARHIIGVPAGPADPANTGPTFSS